MAGPHSPSPEDADAELARAEKSLAEGAGVVVSAAGRLHLGFLDPSATVGRRFGSIGMMVEGAETVVHLAASDVQRFGADLLGRHELGRAARIVGELQRATGRLDPLRVHVVNALPAHVGMGSGTQLALALGRAFSELHGLRLSNDAIASLLGRGGRSGIGLAGFDHGGVLVDGGHRSPSEAGPHQHGGAAASCGGHERADAERADPERADGAEFDADASTARGNGLPPLLARISFPDEWRVIMVQDPSRIGLHGASERSGLARLPAFGRDKAAHLCHLVLMLILPALVERDFPPFARGVSELQRLVGDYFAPVQGGVFSSRPVGRLISWISDHYLAAAGQSSWGPTAFAILPSEGDARHVLCAARAAGVIEAGLTVAIVAGRNRGAVVERIPAPSHAMR